MLNSEGTAGSSSNKKVQLYELTEAVPHHFFQPKKAAMTTTKANLRIKIDELASEADKQTRVQDSATTLLYKGLAELYVWWLDANKYEGFLDELYDELNIKTRSNDDENFVRVIKLMWRIDWNGRRSHSIQKWSVALRKVDHEYTSNKGRYKSNTIENIVLFIQTKGGVNGLVGITKDLDKNPSLEHGRSGKKNSKNSKDLENDAKLKAKNVELAEQYFANEAKPIIRFDLGDFKIPLSDKNYALALVRKTSGSKFQILSMTEGDDLISEAMIRTYKRQQDSAPKTLRLIAEIIQTQALPTQFEKHRYSLAPKSKVKTELEKPMKQVKRLLYRAATKDFLLSENRTDCSVVTIATPIDFAFRTNTDTFLNANDRTFIEQKIIQERNLSFFDVASSKEIVENKDDKLKASHYIMSKYKIDGYIRNLYFYRLDALSPQSQPQATTKNDLSDYLWEAQVDASWLSALNANFLNLWLRSFGASVNQRRNQLLRIDLAQSSFIIHYDGAERHFSKYSENFKVIYLKKSAQNLKLTFTTNDLIPTLNALTEQTIIGRIKISANEDVLTFSYKTASAQYVIAIPTSDTKGKRNKTAFVAYGESNGN